MAEGIMRHKIEKYKLSAEVDSCGFESFHTGDPPDRRAMSTALSHGVDISKLKARLFRVSDFDTFDKIYVMDSGNYRDVASKARSKVDLQKVDFILNTTHPGKNLPVPDPYYGGLDGFEKTWQLLDEATDRIAEAIKNNKQI